MGEVVEGRFGGRASSKEEPLVVALIEFCDAYCKRHGIERKPENYRALLILTAYAVLDGTSPEELCRSFLGWLK